MTGVTDKTSQHDAPQPAATETTTSPSLRAGSEAPSGVRITARRGHRGHGNVAAGPEAKP